MAYLVWFLVICSFFSSYLETHDKFKKKKKKSDNYLTVWRIVMESLVFLDDLEYFNRRRVINQKWGFSQLCFMGINGYPWNTYSKVGLGCPRNVNLFFTRWKVFFKPFGLPEKFSMNFFDACASCTQRCQFQAIKVKVMFLFFNFFRRKHACALCAQRCQLRVNKIMVVFFVF